MDRRNFIAASLSLPWALPWVAAPGLARAETGPLTKIIFPFAAGGGGDTLCRMLAQRMSQLLDRSIIVENRTGADGLIAIRAVKGAKPDGATILVTTGPTMYLLPMVQTEPSFNAEADFVPVSLLARFEFGLVIGPAVDAKDFSQFVAWLKAHPDKATYGVPSNGTIPHFTGTQIEKILGLPLTRVPYRGTAPIITDLIGGHLPFGITTIADAMAQHRTGGVRILAVSSAERSPFLPNVPTLKECGIDLVADAWYGMWLPAGSGADLAGKLGEAAAKALSEPDMREKLIALGLIPVGTNADGLKRELAADTAFWQPIVKATGYKIEN